MSKLLNFLVVILILNPLLAWSSDDRDVQLKPVQVNLIRFSKFMNEKMYKEVVVCELNMRKLQTANLMALGERYKNAVTKTIQLDVAEQINGINKLGALLDRAKCMAKFYMLAELYYYPFHDYMNLSQRIEKILSDDLTEKSYLEISVKLKTSFEKWSYISKSMFDTDVDHFLDEIAQPGIPEMIGCKMVGKPFQTYVCN